MNMSQIILNSEAELRAILNEFREQEYCCDFEIQNRGISYHCHKIILAAQSTYFRILFQDKDIAATKNKSVQCLDIDKSCVEKLLYFMYTKKITVTYRDVVELSVIGEYLGMQTLQDQCVKFLLSYPISDCLVDLFVHICKQENKNIIKRLVPYFAENFVALSSRYLNMLAIPAEELLEILTSPVIRTNVEAVACFLVKWTKAQTQCSQSLEKIVRVLDWNDLNSRLVELLVQNVALIEGDDSKVGIIMHQICNADKLPKCDFHNLMIYTLTLQESNITSITSYKVTKGLGVVLSEILISPAEGNKKFKIFSVDGLSIVYVLNSLGNMSLYLLNDCERKSLPNALEWRNVTSDTLSTISTNIYFYNCSKNFDVYDCGRNYWFRLETAEKDFITVRDPNLTTFDGHLYLVGGRRENSSNENFGYLQHYDVKANRWNQLAHSKYDHTNGAVCVYNGKLYVSGGDYCSYYQCPFEVFDFKTGKWDVLPPLPEPKRNHTMIAHQNLLICAGGVNNAGYDGNERDTPSDLSIFAYDITKNKWSAPFDIPARIGGNRILKIYNITV